MRKPGWVVLTQSGQMRKSIFAKWTISCDNIPTTLILCVWQPILFETYTLRDDSLDLAKPELLLL